MERFGEVAPTISEECEHRCRRNAAAGEGSSGGARTASSSDTAPADYTLHIKAAPIEIAPKRIVSAATYNGQFPGPLLRFKEGRLVTIDVFNHTDTPEQLHWHGQQVPVEADGAAACIHAETRGLSLLSHAQSRGRRSFRRTVERAGRAGIHRAERKSRTLRPRNFSSVERV